MTNPLLQEDKIQINLQVDQQQTVNKVEIAPRRNLHVGQVFEGKSIQQVLTLLPLLFNVCGQAHSVAGIRAIESAVGRKEPVWLGAVRNQLVAVETISEHCWRILLEWPELINKININNPKRDCGCDKKSLAQIRQVTKAFNTGLKLAVKWPEGLSVDYIKKATNQALAQQKDTINALVKLLETKIFGCGLDQWLQINSIDDLNRWSCSTNSTAAQMLQLIIEKNWSAVGNNDTEYLPDMTATVVDSINKSFDQRDFISEPVWLGKPKETSCLSRNHSALISQIKQVYGKGILARLVARLTEIAHLAGLLQNNWPQPKAEFIFPTHDYYGLGQVQAARGLLLHRVKMEADYIQSYQVVAPTEWNFHPQGLVAQGLAGTYGSDEEITNQAHCFIESVDPCVAYDLNLNHL